METKSQFVKNGQKPTENFFSDNQSLMHRQSDYNQTQNQTDFISSKTN